MTLKAVVVNFPMYWFSFGELVYCKGKNVFSGASQTGFTFWLYCLPAFMTLSELFHHLRLSFFI